MSRQPAEPLTELHSRNQHFYFGYDNTEMMGTGNMIRLDWFRVERQIQLWDAKQSCIVYSDIHALGEEKSKIGGKAARRDALHMTGSFT